MPTLISVTPGAEHASARAQTQDANTLHALTPHTANSVFTDGAADAARLRVLKTVTSIMQATFEHGAASPTSHC